MGCNNIPKELLNLIDNITINLKKIPGLNLQYTANTKNKYIPHVTLFKKAALENIQFSRKSDFSFEWQVKNFYLIKSLKLQNNLEYNILNIF